VIRAKEQGKVTDELARMLMLMARKLATKSNFAGYSYVDDMVSDALVDLMRTALKFDHERFDNPFAYYTTCITRSFLGYLGQEKKHRRIRDAILVEIGSSPSQSYQDEMKTEFAAELAELNAEIAEARVRKVEDEAKDAAERAEKAAI